jgi:hypothetical protein
VGSEPIAQRGAVGLLSRARRSLRGGAVEWQVFNATRRRALGERQKVEMAAG